MNTHTDRSTVSSTHTCRHCRRQVVRDSGRWTHRTPHGGWHTPVCRRSPSYTHSVR